MMNASDIGKRFFDLKGQGIWAALIGIFFIGFSVRYLAHGPKLGALDPWFYYRLAQDILTLGYLPQIDTMSYYPTGRVLRETDLLFLAYFVAYTYKVVQFTGISLMAYMIAFPAIFGGLSSIPLYFMTKEIFNERTGLLTALIYASIPAALSRTWAGFCDKEGLAGFLIFLWLALFFISYKKVELDRPRSFILPALAGIVLGLSHVTWAGTRYSTFVVGLSALAYLSFKVAYKKDINLEKEDKSLVYSMLIISIVGYIAQELVQSPNPSLDASMYFIHDVRMASFFLAPLIFLVAITSTSLSRYAEKNLGKDIPGEHIMAIFLGLFGLWIFSTGLLTEYQHTVKGALWALFGQSKDLLGSTVAENLKSTFLGGGDNLYRRIINGDWFAHLNYTLFVLPAGFFLILRRFGREKDFGSVFSLVFVTSGMLAMGNDIRLNFIFAPSIAMLTSYALFTIFGGIVEREKAIKKLLKTTKNEKVRYKTESEVTNLKIFKGIVILVIFFVTFSVLNAGVGMMGGRKSDIPAPWYDAMMWIKENTEEDAIIISWWDYGYWIQTIANRTTVVDGGNAFSDFPWTDFPDGDHSIARMFTTADEETDLGIIRSFRAGNRPVYVLVSLEEFGKSGAINHIAQDNLFILNVQAPNSGDPDKDSQQISDFFKRNKIGTYHILNYGSHYQIWFLADSGHPEMKEKLLAKLLPFNTGFGQGLEHFNMVYMDQKYRYVYIYKVV